DDRKAGERDDGHRTDSARRRARRSRRSRRPSSESTAVVRRSTTKALGSHTSTRAVSRWDGVSVGGRLGGGGGARPREQGRAVGGAPRSRRGVKSPAPQRLLATSAA